MTFSSFQSRLGDLSEPPSFSAKLLRRLWLGLPIAACGLVATVLATVVLVPLLLNLRSEMLRAQRLQFLQDQLKEVNTSLARTQAALKQADSQTNKLRNLLVGGGDRGTVLATLENDAKATGVRLSLFEQNGLPLAPGATPAKPGTPPAPGAKPAPPAGAPAAPAPGAPAAPGAPGAAAVPAAAEGVEEKPLLLSVQGTFPQILAFLQRLERLQVMVKQQDLSLGTDDKPAGGAPAPGSVLVQGSPILVMKLALVVFDAPGDVTDSTSAAKPAGKAAAGPQGVRSSGGGPPGPPPAGAPAAAGSPPTPGSPAPGSPTPGNTAPIRPGPGSPPVPPAPPAFPPAGSSR